MKKICQVTLNRKSFPAKCGDILLDAALLNGVELVHDCRSGICGACLFSVMTMLYLSSVSLHWPPTSGVFAMFLAANGGTLSEPKTTGPAPWNKP